MGKRRQHWSLQVSKYWWEAQTLPIGNKLGVTVTARATTVRIQWNGQSSPIGKSVTDRTSCRFT